MSDTLPDKATSITGSGGEFWVFGYGSLIWRPGFEFVEREPATIHGFHRAFCVKSIRHRGTQDQPGVVLGLDRGGSCRGVAFRVAASKTEETLAYLTEREQLNRIYHERTIPARLGNGRRANVLAYVVDRSHRQYTGRLDHRELLALIEQGHGQSGTCRDYVLNTLDALGELGMEDHALSWLRGALSA